MKKKEDFNYKEFEEDAIKRLREGSPLGGEDGVLRPLIKRFLEASLEGELESHLETDPEPNRRNGKMGKSLKTGYGEIDIETPRDRNSTFEPQIIRKRQTVLNQELDDRILSMYSRGMSYKERKNKIAGSRHYISRKQ